MPTLEFKQGYAFQVNQAVTAVLKLSTQPGTYGVKLTLTSPYGDGPNSAVDASFDGSSAEVPIVLAMPSVNAVFTGAKVEIWRVVNGVKGETVFSQPFTLAHEVTVSGGLQYSVYEERLIDPFYGTETITLVKGLRDITQLGLQDSYYVWRFKFSGNQYGNLQATLKLDNLQVGSFLLDYTGQTSIAGFAVQFSVPADFPVGAHAVKVEYYFNGVKLTESVKSVLVEASLISPYPDQRAVSASIATRGRYAAVVVNKVYEMNFISQPELIFSQFFPYSGLDTIVVDFYAGEGDQYFDVYNADGTQFITTLSATQMNAFGFNWIRDLRFQ